MYFLSYYIVSGAQLGVWDGRHEFSTNCMWSHYIKRATLIFLVHIDRFFSSATTGKWFQRRFIWRYRKNLLRTGTNLSSADIVIRRRRYCRPVPPCRIDINSSRSSTKKGAYASVDRQILLTLVKQKSSDGSARMVQSLLQPFAEYGRTNRLAFPAILKNGVLQAYPASLTLFKMFMETLLCEFDTVSASMSRWPAVCYADDVFLTAKSAEGLQKLLNLATIWVTQHNMTWAPQKASILTEGSETTGFTLAGATLSSVERTYYLGSTIWTSGLHDDETKGWIKRAHGVLNKCRRTRVSFEWRRKGTRSLVEKFLLPIIDYGTQLWNLNSTTVLAMANFERRYLRWLLGLYFTHVSRAKAVE